jgi:beta-lactam-binding protein with PASTA domain
VIGDLKNKPLWVNVLASFGLLALALLLFLLSLNWITNHGKTIVIPSVTGMRFAEATALLEKEGFDVEVQDSLYHDTLPPLSVIRQFPEADELVKIHRTVYLTISRSVPPSIDMPLLEGLSLRNAEIVLKQYGLKWDTLYRPDFAKNAVLEQQYKGVRIKPGTKINMGSTVQLVLGSGLGSGQFAVPDLIGLTYTEAKILIESNGLFLNIILPDADVTDTASAFVYRQQPERLSVDGRINRIRVGQSMDVFLGVEKPARNLPENPPADNKNDY